MLSRFYLIRHGAVDERWQGRIYGAREVPLSPAGERDSLALARRLERIPFAAVVSSGLERAEFLARALRERRGLARNDDPDLRELERGAWAGLSPAELERSEPGAWGNWLRQPAILRPPGGETLADLSCRVLPALDRWAARHAGTCIAVVTHSWVARIAACAALGLDEAKAALLEVPTATLVVLDWPARVDGASAASSIRPTLVAFATRDVPPEGMRWFHSTAPLAKERRGSD
jgi:broad specificity phosphatase PhoE